MAKPRKPKENETVSREEVIAGLKAAVDSAIQKGNLTAVVSAWEKLGKTLAMFTDVQKVEDPFSVMDQDQMLSKIDAIVYNNDLLRERFRMAIQRWDDSRGGGPPPANPAVGGPAVPRGRIH